MRRLSRLLLVIDVAHDARQVFEAARRLAPNATEVHVVALVGSEHRREELTASLAAGPALTWPSLANHFVRTSFDTARVTETAQQLNAELVVLGPWSAERSIHSRAMLALELGAAGYDVLSVGLHVGDTPRDSGVIGLIIDGAPQALHTFATQVERLLAPVKLVAFTLAAPPDQLDHVELTLRAISPRAPVDLVALSNSRFGAAEAIERNATLHRIDFVVARAETNRLSAYVTGFFAATTLQNSPHPILILPPEGVERDLQRLASADGCWLAGIGLRLALEHHGPLGRTPLPVHEQLLLVGFEERGPLMHDEGVATLPPTWFASAVPQALAIASHEHRAQVANVRVVTPSATPVVLVDAEIPTTSLADVERLVSHASILFVRLRATEGLEALRTRLNAAVPWGGPVVLLDASACLDDGGASDVPPALDGLRLLRLGHVLLEHGHSVNAVVTREATQARSTHFEVLDPESLRSRAQPSVPPTRVDEPRAIGGNALSLDFDNRVARETLLAALGAARSTIHWECYIVDEDATAALVLRELASAAARGVRVRLLVDALYSRHEAFGFTNPLLTQLARAEGVEVRTSRPLAGVPSMADLKQRNHRKLVTIDGGQAFVGGRNLGGPYFTGFDEVPLSPTSAYRDVPWLDSGVRLFGPMVEQLERVFLSDWVAAGGASFEVARAQPVGSHRCRLVVHEGLRDTHTFDYQLSLAERARTSLVVMNTFPMAVELQRALTRAVRRGVQVRLVVGTVRPRRDDEQPFDGGALRELVDDLVRARIEPILSAGAEGWEVCVEHQDCWSPELARVYPHVHSKVLLRDDEELAIGSANVDVTSAYWESELLLVVDDSTVAQAAAKSLDEIISRSRRVDIHSEAWRKELSRRVWLGKNWPAWVG